MLKMLDKTIHPFLSYLTVAAVALSSFCIIGIAFAQTTTDIQDQAANTLMPIIEPQPPLKQPDQPPAPVQTNPPVEQVQYGEGGTIIRTLPSSNNNTCAPGTDCSGNSGCAAGTTCDNQNLKSDGQMMPQQFNQGPSEEEMKKMDEQRLSQMKRSLNQLTMQIKKVKTLTEQLKKKGITIAEELTTAINDSTGAVEKIKNAQTADEADEASSDLHDAFDTMQNWLQELQRLNNYPRMIREAEKIMKNANRLLTSYEKKIKNTKNIDLSSVFADFKTAVTDQQTLLNQIKETAKTDASAAFDKLEDEFFPAVDNMYENQRVMDMTLNIKKNAIPQMTRELKQAENKIKALKKKKLDTAELENLLSSGQNQLAEVKKLAAEKSIDPEAMMAAIDDLMQTQQDFADEVYKLTGENQYLPQQQPPQNIQLNLPQTFQNSNQQPKNNEPG